MNNSNHDPVFEAVAAALKGIADTEEVFSALAANAPQSAATAAVVPRVAQLSRLLRNLKIQLYSYGDSDDAVADAVQRLRAEYDRIGIEWFVSYYKEAAFAALNPKRRLAIATWLAEMARKDEIPVPSYWLQIIQSEGLLDHE